MSEDRYQGLLVDFGGVLTTNLWASFDTFCRAEGVGEGAVLRLFRDDPAALADLRELEAGRIEDIEFERRLAPRLGVEPEGLIVRLFAGLEPDETMLAAVGAARRAGVSTGLISNSWGMGIYDRAPVGLFDAVVISGDEGLHKPQPEIYRLGAARIGVEAERCVFVDDLRENVVGAEQVGMAAILHRDPAATVARLERLLGVPLSNSSEGP